MPTTIASSIVQPLPMLETGPNLFLVVLLALLISGLVWLVCFRSPRPRRVRFRLDTWPPGLTFEAEG